MVNLLVNDKYKYIMYWNPKIDLGIINKLFFELHKDEIDEDDILKNDYNCYNDYYHIKYFSYNPEKDYTDYKKIIMCCNPYYRILSTYYDKYLLNPTSYNYKNRFISNNFEDFIDKLSNISDEKIYEYHFRQQSCELLNYPKPDIIIDTINLKKLIPIFKDIFANDDDKFKYCEKYLKKNKKINETIYKNYDKYMGNVNLEKELIYPMPVFENMINNNILEKIYTRYKDDFDFFKYKKLLKKDFQSISNIKKNVNFTFNKEMVKDIFNELQINKYLYLNHHIQNELSFIEYIYKNKIDIKKIPKDFNWKDYVIINNDVKGFNEIEAKTHYFLNGRKENREYKYDIPDDFNWKHYIIINEDLSHMTQQEAISHYITNGWEEKRNYKYDISYDFNWIHYTILNQDLSHMTEKEAIEHYIKYGISENRIYKCNIPDDFNWKYYLYINEDLSHMTEKEAIVHYMKYGKNENRVYKYDIPDDFNWMHYIKLNKDLSHMTEKEALEHYVKYGKYEKRIYKI